MIAIPFNVSDASPEEVGRDPTPNRIDLCQILGTKLLTGTILVLPADPGSISICSPVDAALLTPQNSDPTVEAALLPGSPGSEQLVALRSGKTVVAAHRHVRSIVVDVLG